MRSRSRPSNGGSNGADGDEEGGQGPVETDTLLALVNGMTITAETPLSPGQVLEAEQEGAWWEAEVMELRPDGRVSIHYTGWDSSWDEVVPRARLRLASGPPRQVTVRLDTRSAVSGVLISAAEEFLVLQHPDDGRRVFVNRARILYFEVGEPTQP